MNKRSKRSFRRRGQALVEMALLAMLLFFLLSAAVDLGLVFFAYQAIASAAQEGASYGSIDRPPGGLPLKSEIRLRVRNEAGPDDGTHQLPSRVGVVHLQDLNSDGNEDSPGVQGEGNPNGYILIDYVPNEYGNESGTTCDYDGEGREDQVFVAGHCDVQVTVKFDYKPFFFIAPVIGVETISIKATRQMTIVAMQ